MADCIFCNIIAGSIPASKVYEDDRVLAFKDINPVAPVHILVIPKEHKDSLNQMEAGDQELLGHIMLVIIKLAGEMGLATQGYRVINNCGDHGGQTVSHLHFHLLGGRSMTWPPG